MHGTLRLLEAAFADATPVALAAANGQGPLRRLFARLRRTRPQAGLVTAPTGDVELWTLWCAEGEARAAFEEVMEAWAGRD